MNRYLLEKTQEYRKRKHEIIILQDNAPSHTKKPVRDMSEALSWKVLPHAAYSPDLASFAYHFPASTGHAVTEKRFDSYEDVKKWLDDCFVAKWEDFYCRGIHKLPEI